MSVPAMRDLPMPTASAAMTSMNALDNGGCDVNAECRNTEGGRDAAVTPASTVMARPAATSTSVPWITVAAM